MVGKNERRGLGRGLSALMADVQPETPAVPSAGDLRSDRKIPIENLHANPDQPRRTFTPAELESLSQSIAEKGVIQPLIVRSSPKGDGSYEIVAGERRWRASQMAKLHEVPVVIRDFSDIEVLEVAIIENVQREDLNPLEESLGYRALMDRFDRTQEEMSKALSKSRSHIANMLRLLNLPSDVQEYLREGKLSAGHARALVGNENASTLALQVIGKGLSVRATESLVKSTSKRKSAPKQRIEKDADTRALEGELSANTGMKVSIDHSNGKESGQITIKYKNMMDLDKLCNLLS
ncbi:ParB/RepB/Spo0J family partition protein [Halocynthiibacter namhaensis]|uniref:ParB/RepB/Spo0J family partition protein n=1 Tax=Halocynthiibacter namhaensis TaxID=1290553 RepID=UPI0005790430|nr:ParB/RepB/Spo0J family partition protein [Halocynthiibacter namhaensis]